MGTPDAYVAFEDDVFDGLGVGHAQKDDVRPIGEVGG